MKAILAATLIVGMGKYPVPGSASPVQENILPTQTQGRVHRLEITTEDITILKNVICVMRAGQVIP
jgi:hypothetical protein